MLVLGCAGLGNLYATVDDCEAQATFDAAWRAEFRMLDTAPLYGHGLSERRVGRHRHDRPDQSFSLSTKVGRRLHPVASQPTDHGFVDPLPFEPRFDYTADGILASFEDSLARLGANRVDTLLLHDIDRRTHGDQQPAVLRQALNEALPAMARLKAEGRVARIGLGVNEWEVCREVMAYADVDVLLIAGRYTLLEQGALDLMDEAAARGVSVMAAGLFNSGLLVGQRRYDYRAAGADVTAHRDAVARVCDEHGVPAPAAALQLPGAHPAVDAVVVGLRSPAEVEQFAAWWHMPIPGELWPALIAAGLLDQRVPTPC
jgi:D-threo-aldose 1-dehydrogenase